MISRTLSLLSSKFRRRVTVSYISAKDTIHHYKIQRNSNILDALIQAKAPVDYSCKSGLCQSCIVQCDDLTSVPKQAQRGLNEAEKQLGYFLPCICDAEKSLTIRALNHEKQRVETEVIEATLLPEKVLFLRLKAPFSFRAGQFCKLYKDDKTHRSYSIASESNQNELEFHIKIVEGGIFSNWAKDSLAKGEKIYVQGPYGKCIYTPPSTDELASDLLLIGIGTGLAPLIGIIKDALNHSNTQKITLVLGAKTPENFYLTEQLKLLEEGHDQLSIRWISIDSGDHPDITQGDLYDFIKTNFPDLSQHIVYLCGAESFVKKMKKTCYLNNASLNRILSDVFVPGSAS